MDDLIINAMRFLESKGVEFVSNAGLGTIATYKEDTFIWYSDAPYKLYHKDKWKTVDFFKDISKTATFKRLWGEFVDSELTELLHRDDKDLYQVVVNERSLSKHTKDVADWLDNYDILKISSPMATGKSNVIDEAIKQAHDRELKVICITNRVSLSRDIYKKYKQYNLKHYQDSEYNRGDSLVVQFDSLFYYNVEDFDVVIIDEITTLLTHMCKPFEGKEKRYRQNVQMFFKFQGKKILLSDAFIVDYPFTGTELGILNTFREDLRVIEYKDKWAFLNKIIRESTQGKISISSNNKSLLSKISKHLAKRGLKVILLTADTKNKTTIYKELSNKDTAYDAVLFSPTLTVGVSILWDIKHHFHYDISGTVSVVDSIQMTRRSRNAKNIHYYIQGKKSYSPTRLDAIQRKMDSWQIVNEYGETFGINIFGKKLSRLIQMKNIFDNGHHYSFRSLLGYQFKYVENNDVIGQQFKL